MKKEVTVALVALGGYGRFYLRALFSEAAKMHNVRMVAGIDPMAERYDYLEPLREAQIPIYDDLEHFYAESAADLVVISAPIHFHAPFTCLALSRGADVLCEKPVAPTVQEVDAMAEAEVEAEGFVAIGYQWSFADAIQALKRDVMAGTLGRPLRLRTKVLWPRPASYYDRNNWAGALKAPNGQWVLDSPVNNATAHYLHNMLYVLGETRETSARPVSVQAELYRANPIQNYDAAALRCHTEGGAELLFYSAHPVAENVGPIFDYEFEDAVVRYGVGEDAVNIIAHFKDGRVKNYGNPFADDTLKLWRSAEAVRNRASVPLSCGIEAARAHTLCVNGAQESVSDVMSFPETLVQRDCETGDCLTWVEGLQSVLEQCYDQGALPAELGTVEWARSGRVVDLQEYKAFPSA